MVGDSHLPPPGVLPQDGRRVDSQKHRDDKRHHRIQPPDVIILQIRQGTQFELRSMEVAPSPTRGCWNARVYQKGGCLVFEVVGASRCGRFRLGLTITSPSPKVCHFLHFLKIRRVKQGDVRTVTHTVCLIQTWDLPPDKSATVRSCRLYGRRVLSLTYIRG